MQYHQLIYAHLLDFGFDDFDILKPYPAINNNKPLLQLMCWFAKFSIILHQTYLCADLLVFTFIGHFCVLSLTIINFLYCCLCINLSGSRKTFLQSNLSFAVCKNNTPHVQGLMTVTLINDWKKTSNGKVTLLKLNQQNINN